MSIPRTHGGLAAWSIHHPIGVVMLALTVVVLGFFALGRLAVDLLPQIIYPEIQVRVLDPGVPANIMEDRITRQLEEQLAITEDAIGVQSRTNEGSSSVELLFDYGKDIDIALRDASTRLDRAKRFLPTTIDPPIIFKRDPAQIPVAEFIVSSTTLDPIKLRDWVDYDFAKQFLNLPGVAAVEVGGGLVREIQLLPDQERLAASGLSLNDVITALQRGNVELPAGRLTMERRELGGRTAARFQNVQEIAALPLRLKDGTTIRLDEVMQVLDTHADERIKVRLNGTPGVKISIQKQPTANTVAVVDAVRERMAWLQQNKLLLQDAEIFNVDDQSIYVRNALNSASQAALTGTLLAMAVVYLFLGNLRRTLIIGSAIPLAIMVTFVLMGLGDLTFNMMTLGGLALGVGMLVDNTIVMLENIQRHQREGETPVEAGTRAASEIYGAIVASTSTNLAAVLPFLFISGLVGLLFRELIFTISAAILASMVVALTLVPALAVQVRNVDSGRLRRIVDGLISQLQEGYAAVVAWLLDRLWAQALLVATLLAALVLTLPIFSGPQEFLPSMDDGQIQVYLTADPGVSVAEMDRSVHRLEDLFRRQPEVVSAFATIGGFIFGRTERESSNSGSIMIQLVPRSQRTMSSNDWIVRMQKAVAQEELAGVRVRMRSRGIRGIRIGSGDDDLSIRIQGTDLKILAQLADSVVGRLKNIPGLRNVMHSAEEQRQELAIILDRQRTAALGLDAEEVGRTLRHALEGEIVTDFIEHDRSIAVRLRLPRREVDTPRALEELVLYSSSGQPLRLGDVARVTLVATPAEIRRDNQRRIVEISASLIAGTSLSEAYERIYQEMAGVVLPEGYTWYDGGELKMLTESRHLGLSLLALAIFLVFVVMAVQYESLRNPLVILLSIPFAALGVAIGLLVSGLTLSMPVWLGMIMLAGIVVNNAIVLVEYVEIARRQGMQLRDAIITAARLRLRPILMTTLTTVAGMTPLALGLGEGSEMLQPLAVAIIFGLGISLLVTLLLIPLAYRLLHRATTIS
ncbi:MAG: efflux RND transporter permease subunit [Thiohalomonadaceae bacterium]